jgi:hypothetical protein
VQSQQLLTESEVFENKALSGTKSRDNPAEEMPERRDHGKNLTGTPQIELVTKLLILLLHDVLTNDSYRTTTSWGTAPVVSVPASRNKSRFERKMTAGFRYLVVGKGAACKI